MVKYIWQHSSWANFSWDSEKILHALSEAKKSQGYILGQADYFELNDQASIFIEEAFTTAAIEGENLDRDAIRSSVARRLGLPTAGLPGIKKNSDGLVEVLIDATRNYEKKMNRERLCGWQAALFSTGFSGIKKIGVGHFRRSASAMQVVSGRMGKEKVHFEAPPSTCVAEEMKKFLDWWNSPPQGMDGLVRAAVAHFWFVTIHPFDDGNGRIARALTDMALAQEEKLSKRLYSLSSQIMKERESYYEILEKTQKGKGDITEWIVWFLAMFKRGVENSKTLIEKSIFIGKFYRHHARNKFNDRQLKVLQKLLEYLPEDFQGGLTNKKYVNMTHVSSETAKRDLKDLVDKGVLLQGEGKGRSVSYRLNREIFNTSEGRL